jgi:hypothetical protein
MPGGLSDLMDNPRQVKRLLTVIGGVTVALAASAIYFFYSGTPEFLSVQHEPVKSDRTLEYVWVGTDTRFESGSLSIRNKDRADWSDVRVELWVQVSPGNRSIKFTCASPSNIRRGDVLTVAYRACTTGLARDSDSASVSSVHIIAREGAIQVAFEPGLRVRG